jgi:hypothetical protein
MMPLAGQYLNGTPANAGRVSRSIDEKRDAQAS